VKTRFQSHSTDDLIVEVWESLGDPPVGQSVLKRIQRVISEKFGSARLPGPASISRTLADAGAELRHPEVLEYDAIWREAESQKQSAGEPEVLFDLENSWSLKTAAVWITKLEELRVESDDANAVKRLEARAREAKRQAQLFAASSLMTPKRRLAAAEISEWLTIWLQTPELFPTWLNLRRQSPEFLGKFARKTTEARP
jgi:hypothetical protein